MLSVVASVDASTHQPAVSLPTPAPEVVSSGHCSRCSNMQRRYETAKRHNVCLRRRYKAALRKIRNMLRNKTKFSAAVGKFLHQDQLSCLSRNSTRGVKWSKSTIKKGLQLHFTCGPTGYKELLSQKYPLPSHRTLLRSMQHVQFESGVLSEVFNYLGVKVAFMSTEEKQCVLTLDEMAIKPAVELDNRTGHFIGDVTLPGHSGAATHALVFMLGGISTRWKQTVAYYLTGNSTDGTVLCEIVKRIILACDNISLNVMAVTTDMGSINRAMWKMLGVVSNKEKCSCSFPHPGHPGQSVYVFADVPHLVKNLRNHFVNGQDIVLPADVVKKFNLPTAVVCVKPVKLLVDYQSGKDLKPAPKLTEKHLEPSHFDKMKVSHAMAVFSKSVSAALHVMVDTGVYDQSALTTAWFVDIVNHWFDLMSSRHPIVALSKFDQAKYVEAVEFLNMVNDLFRRVVIGNEHWKPVQSGVILSTTSMLLVHEQLLNENNFKFVLTSRFSQDCLENLFSCIRRKNATPTSLEFKNCLRVLTVAQYLKGCDTGSYELDEGSFIADFLNPSVLQTGASSADSVDVGVFEACKPLLDSDDNCVVFDAVEMNCLYYLGGYIVASVKKHEVTCERCFGELCANETEPVEESLTKLVRHKEYRSGCLVPCSQAVFDVVIAAEMTFRSVQHTLMAVKSNLKDILVQKISQRTTDATFSDCHSIKEKIIKCFENARLQFFAKRHSKLRRGKLSKSSGHELSSKSMQMRKSVRKIK